MTGCNENCHCFVQGADGIATDGLGDAESPYTIGVDDNRTIPMVGTHAERLALDTTDLMVGFRFFETDTGQEFVLFGGSAWEALTTAFVSSSDESGTLTASPDAFQDIASAPLSVGFWVVIAKGNIEASVAAMPPVVWTPRLYDVTNGIVADIIHTSGVFEDPDDPTKSFARPFSLCSMYHLAGDATMKLQIARDLTTGSQLFIDCHITAIRIPGIG